MLKEKVMEMLDDKINEVFEVMQDDLHIENGDVFPLDVFELDKCKEDLANKIVEILISQQ